MKTFILVSILLFTAALQAQNYLVMDVDWNYFSRISINADTYTRVTGIDTIKYPVKKTYYDVFEDSSTLLSVSLKSDSSKYVFINGNIISEYIEDPPGYFEIKFYLDSLDMPVRIWQPVYKCISNATDVYREGCPGIDSLFGDCAEVKIYRPVNGNRIYIPWTDRDRARY